MILNSCYLRRVIQPLCASVSSEGLVISEILDMSLHSVDAIEVFAIIIPTHKPHLSYLSHMNRFVYQ